MVEATLVTAQISEEELIRKRKEKFFSYFKNNWNLVSYVILALIILLAFQIRTSNLDGLKDVTTGTWTLGPDLDPFLFLRMSIDIISNGHLNEPDMMRYVPLGFHQEKEYLLLPFMMSWFYKLASVFGPISITQSAVLFPAFMFILTAISFFLMVREIFVDLIGKRDANVVALIASFFLGVIPSLLPRTIAGIPEKESIGFMFIFISIYFYIAAFKKNGYQGYLFAVLGGLSMAAMIHAWGGHVFLTFTILPATIAAYLLGKFEDNTAKLKYVLWVVTTVGASLLAFLVLTFSKYSLVDYAKTQFGALSFFVLLVFAVDHLDSKKKLLKKVSKYEFPEKLIVLIASIILALVFALIFFGPGFIVSNLDTIYSNSIKPATSRLIQTVAENRQPYFTEWVQDYGPNLGNFMVFFWLMIIGSFAYFYQLTKRFEKEDRIKLTFAFCFAAFAIVFSRYSPSSALNGENFISKFILFLGLLGVFASLAFYYWKYSKKDKEILRSLDLASLCLLAFYLLGLVSARAGVRFIMVLAPSAAIFVGFMAVHSFRLMMNNKDKTRKIVVGGFFLIVAFLTFYAGLQYYNQVSAEAKNYVPSIYTQQWQKAMEWVRNETPKNAVFGHWWDYGYWIQSIGERATVLDGGNFLAYWNHMMGRYALTGSNETEALEFLYAHNTTYFLIDSTDIGKYSAFSSIGSNETYDRTSYIPAFLRDPSQTQEKKNSSVQVYPAGIGLDEDLIYYQNGSKIFLPSGKAGLAAVLIERDNNNTLISQPIGVFVYGGVPYNLPLRYLYKEGKFKDYGSGVESGIFFMPRIDQQANNIQIEQDGAMLYLSRRVVKSQLARLYIYKENNAYFRLVHSEDDFVVSQLKQQGAQVDNDLVYFQGVRGPIRIWEIQYPKNINFKEEYLSTNYPESLFNA